MVTVYCALYPEAQELICTYHLKKEADRQHFQVFSSEEAKVRLVVTGVGTAAAVAVSETSTLYPPGKTDFLVNFGSCGGCGFSLEEVYLCNKIVDAAGGRTFYPDVLYRHPFSEAEITSFPRPQAYGQMPASLCDMEAATVYQSGSYYYSTHQMVFLKVVVDDGVAGKVSVREFGKQMKTGTARVTGFLDRLREISDLNGGRKAEQLFPAWILEEFHGSKTMQAKLCQMLRYFELTGTDYETLLNGYRRSGRLPCDKQEGKKILEELKSRLF